jgi:WD40 repeat protein
MTASATREKVRPALEKAAAGYDAFLSYSHAADGRLAPALQQALQTMAKPWYRRRALRVFRDQTSLTATPELWGSIQQALASSQVFIFLASPHAAASPWVEQEAAWWRANRDREACFVALTDGELDWDDVRGDFTEGSSVPPSLRGWFASEPLWVDLRWARTEQHLSQRDPRFRDSVADLAAPLHGLPKDELVGEDIRLHRRAMRLARGAAAALVVLTLLAAVAAVVAVIQRNTARDQTSLATARQIGATATGALSSRLDIANGLAAEAYARRPTDQTEAALFAAVSASPHLVRIRSADAEVTRLMPGVAADEMLVADARGRVRTWSLRDGRFGPSLVQGDAPVRAVRVSPSRELLAVGDEAGTISVLALTGEAEPRRFRIRGTVDDVAIDSRSRWLAAAGEQSGVTLFDLRSGRQTARVEPDLLPGVVRFTQQGSILVVGSIGGATQRFLVPLLWSLGEPTASSIPANDSAEAWSADRRFFGLHKFGMRVRDSEAGGRERFYPLDTGSSATAVAVGPKAQRTAVAAGGVITVLREREAEAGNIFGDAGGQVADSFTGLSITVSQLMFAADGRRLVSAAGDLLALWDSAQRSRIAHRVAAVELPDPSNLVVPPGIATSTDGAHVLVGDEDGALTVVAARTGQRAGHVEPASLIGGPRSSVGVLLEDDGRTATVVDDDFVDQIDVVTGETSASIPIDTDDNVAAVLRGPGGRPLVVFDDGAAAIVDVTGGRLRPTAKAIPGATGENSLFVTDIAFAQERGTLYAAVGERLWVTDLKTRRRAAWRPPAGVEVASAAVANDGRTVVTSDERAAAHVWDPRTRSVARTLDTGPVSSVHLDPSGRRLVALQRNGAMSVWHPSSGAKLGEAPLADTQVGIQQRGVSGQTAVAFARDGTIWTGITGQGLYAWSMSPEAWLRSTCETAGRALTREEWQRYLGVPYEPKSRC